MGTWTQIATGSAVAVSSTELSLLVDGASSSLQSIDDDRKYRLLLKIGGLAAGEIAKLQVKSKVTPGGSQETVREIYYANAMAEADLIEWDSTNGFDITIVMESGSATVSWTAWSEDPGAIASLAAGSITAAVVATGAIDADALATDGVNKIADQVWDEALAGHAVAGSAGAALSAAAADGGGGASVDDILNEPLAGHAGAGTVGAALIASRDGVGTLTTAIDAVPTNAELTTALSPLALSTQVDTVEASLATLATAVGDVPTNAELATALDPLATSVEVTAAVAPLATSAEVSALDAVVDAVEAALLAAIDAVPTNAELATAVAPLATSAGVTSATAPLATAANLATVVGYIDTEITTILANVAAVAAAIAALSIPTAAQVGTQVWATALEGARSAAGLLRTVARVAVGAATQPEDGDGTYTYRDLDDTKDAVVIEIAGDARTRTSLDDD